MTWCVRCGCYACCDGKCGNCDIWREEQEGDELEQVKRRAEYDIPHNCHTCKFRADAMCPGNSLGFQKNCERWEWRGLEKED